MTDRPPEPPLQRLRAALAPLAWLGVALFFASALGLVVQVVLPSGPDAGRWNPAWSFAEVQLEGVDASGARAWVEEARPAFPGCDVDWRPAEEGSWIVVAGPSDRRGALGQHRRPPRRL